MLKYLVIDNTTKQSSIVDLEQAARIAQLSSDDIERLDDELAVAEKLPSLSVTRPICIN